MKIGNNSIIKSFSYIEGSNIAKNVTIGPYARLREGTILNDNVKVGNFCRNQKIKNK